MMVLPPRATSARTARKFVTGALEQWSLGELAETTELLTSELVSNVVLHARSTFRLRVHRESDRGGRVRVEVADDSPALPRRRDHDERDTGGRGLVLVDALARDWGVQVTEDGKIVWFEVAP